MNTSPLKTILAIITLATAALMNTQARGAEKSNTSAPSNRRKTASSSSSHSRSAKTSRAPRAATQKGSAPKSSTRNPKPTAAPPSIEIIPAEEVELPSHPAGVDQSDEENAPALMPDINPDK